MDNHLIVYGDDATALIATRNIELPRLRLKMAMQRVHGLSLALGKIDIVMLTKKHIQTIIPMLVGELDIETKPSVFDSKCLK